MKITLDLTDVEIESLLALNPIHRPIWLDGDRYIIRIEAVSKNEEEDESLPDIEIP